MNAYEKIVKLADKDFKLITGVTREVFDTMLSKLRVSIEHINRELKIFRICKETYRGKGERGLLRVRLLQVYTITGLFFRWLCTDNLYNAR